MLYGGHCLLTFVTVGEQLDASFRREKQLRSELAISRQTALQQHDLIAQHFGEVCHPRVVCSSV